MKPRGEQRWKPVFVLIEYSVILLNKHLAQTNSMSFPGCPYAVRNCNFRLLSPIRFMFDLSFHGKIFLLPVFLLNISLFQSQRLLKNNKNKQTHLAVGLKNNGREASTFKGKLPREFVSFNILFTQKVKIVNSWFHYTVFSSSEGPMKT